MHGVERTSASAILCTARAHWGSKEKQSTTHGRNLGSNSTTGYYASFLAFFPPKINFIPPKRTRDRGGGEGGGVLSQNFGPQNALFPSETYSRRGEVGRF